LLFFCGAPVGRGNLELKSEAIVSAQIKQAKKLSKELYKSLTWDRGKPQQRKRTELSPW
jgi:IS30 family transposase